MYDKNFILHDHSIYLNKLIGLSLFLGCCKNRQFFKKNHTYTYCTLLEDILRDKSTSKGHSQGFIDFIRAYLNLSELLEDIIFEQIKENKDMLSSITLDPIEQVLLIKLAKVLSTNEELNFETFFAKYLHEDSEAKKITEYIDKEVVNALHSLYLNFSCKSENSSINSTRLILENAIKNMYVNRFTLTIEEKKELEIRLEGVLNEIEALQKY